MKKLFFLGLVLTLALAAGTSGALAYQFGTVDVNVYDSSNAPLGWLPGYGGGDYRVFGADLTGSTLSVFLNTQTANVFPPYVAADLFIDKGCDGSWDYVVKTDSSGAFTFTGLQYTADLWAGTHGYGKEFNQAAPQTTPAAATGTTLFVAAPVTYNPLTVDTDPATPAFRVDYDLSLLVGSLGDKWGFVQTGANCGNYATTGCVPLPGAVLLFGAGMARLAAYARRRRHA